MSTKLFSMATYAWIALFICLLTGNLNVNGSERHERIIRDTSGSENSHQQEVSFTELLESKLKSFKVVEKLSMFDKLLKKVLMAADVAFAVYTEPYVLPSGWIPPPPRNQPLRFNVSYVNNRHVYNLTTGQFTSPKEGLYMFHVSLYTFDGKEVDCWLRVNETKVARLQVQDQSYRGSGDSMYAVQAYTTYLHVGDTVDVLYEKGSVYKNESMFLGFILKSKVAFTVDSPNLYGNLDKWGRPELLTPNLRPGDAIHFVNVTTNEGEGYNSSSGKFTCPQSGLYVFIVSLKTYNARTEYLKAALAKNGIHVMVLEERDLSRSKGDDLYAYTSIIMKLEKNDWVHVVYLKGDVSFESYFTGYLLENDAAFAVRHPETVRPGYIPYMGSQHPLKFDEVIVNEQGIYDNKNGKVTIQEPGLYVFYVNIVSHDVKKQLICWLRVNGKEKLQMEVQDRSVGEDKQLPRDADDNRILKTVRSAPRAIILWLNAGDIVDIMYETGSGINEYSIFCGHRL